MFKLVIELEDSFVKGETLPHVVGQYNRYQQKRVWRLEDNQGHGACRVDEIWNTDGEQ